jgi:hypothetical protein
MDSRIPSKKNLYEFTLHELWGQGHSSVGRRNSSNSYQPNTASQAFSTGRGLGPNVLATSVDSVSTESLFLLALKVLSIQPRVAHFMICSAKSNVLQDYCWPVCRPHNEASVMKDLSLKRDFFRSVFEVDRVGDSSVDRYLMLSNEIKSFCPQITGNQLVWGESFHILSRHRAFERSMRQPPTVLVEMVRKGLHQTVRNDQFLTVPSLPSSSHTIVNGHSIVQDSINSIKLEDISTRPVPGIKNANDSKMAVNQINNERQLGPNSFARNPTAKKSIQEQSFELAIARYFEATLDALLESIFQFIIPILRIAADDIQPFTTDAYGSKKESESNDINSLLKFVSQSTAIAMDAVRFQGILADSQKSDVREKMDNGIMRDSHKFLKNKSQKGKLLISSDLEPFPDSEELRDCIRQYEESNGFKTSNYSSLSKILRRRKLQVEIELPEADRASFESRVALWKKPRSIQQLRKQVSRLRSSKLNFSVSDDVQTGSDRIGNANSEMLSNSRKRKLTLQQQNFSESQKKRKLNSLNSPERMAESEEESDDDSLNSILLNSKQQLAESMPLPVPLSRVHYPTGWKFRKALGSQLLRWQKGGIIGSGQRHRLQIRRLKVGNRMRRNKRKSSNYDDISVLSATTEDDHDGIDRFSESSVSTKFESAGAIKIVAAAPSVAGTLETHFRYREQEVNAKTDNFENSEPVASVEDEKQEISWEHILTVLQTIHDICDSSDENSIEEGVVSICIHPDLPTLRLDRQTLKRIQYRLVSIFTNFLRENEPQHYPLATADGDIAVPRDIYSSISAIPQVLRSTSYFPKTRMESTVASLPPSFLLAPSANDGQYIRNMLKNLEIKQLSAMNGNDSTRSQDCLFKNDDELHTKDSQLQANLLGKAAIQSIFGYGAVESGDYPNVSRPLSLDESHRLDNDDVDSPTDPVDPLTAFSTQRRNHHFFPRPVFIAAKKLSVRYQYHLKRLRKKYPPLPSPQFHLERESHSFEHDSDENANDDIGSLDYIPSTKNYPPFQTESPMKMRNLVTMSSGDSNVDGKVSVSPSQSLASGMLEDDSDPSPTTYLLGYTDEFVHADNQLRRSPVNAEVGKRRREITRFDFYDSDSADM